MADVGDTSDDCFDRLDAVEWQFMKIKDNKENSQNRKRKTFGHLKNVVYRFVRLDMHFMLSTLIFFVLGFAFVTEFLFYALVKLLVGCIENLCMPPTVKKLRKRMLRAETQEEYDAVACKLDDITGRERWKYVEESPYYDHNLVNRRTTELRRARTTMDLRALLSTLKATVDTVFFETRGGVLTEALYSKTYCGTKCSVDEFLEEVLVCVDVLTKCVHQKMDPIGSQLASPRQPSDADPLSSAMFVTPTLSPSVSAELLPVTAVRNVASHRIGHQSNPCSPTPGSDVTMEYIKLVLNQIRCQWGETALVLSGGAALGWHHFGVLEPLIQQNLIPRVICGTSAGAAVAGWLCTRHDAELLTQLHPQYLLPRMKPLQPEGIWGRFKNFVTQGYCCDVDVWQKLTMDFFGNITFAEAFAKTGRVLNVSLTRADRQEPPLILNYTNASSVLIASAVIASCSFPGLGPPFHLQEKAADGQNIFNSELFAHEYFHDGSIIGDIPLEPLKEIWGIQFSIVSQVNAHVFPFCGLRAHGEAGRPVAWGASSDRYGWRGGFLLSGSEVALKEHLRFLLRLIVLLNVSPTFKGVNIANLVQSYSGDITIHPRRLFWPHRNFMFDPTPEEAHWYIQEGKQMVFPKMSIIRSRLRVDKALRNLFAAASQDATTPRTPPMTML